MKDSAKTLNQKLDQIRSLDDFSVSDLNKILDDFKSDKIKENREEKLNELLNKSVNNSNDKS